MRRRSASAPRSRVLRVRSLRRGAGRGRAGSVGSPAAAEPGLLEPRVWEEPHRVRGRATAPDDTADGGNGDPSATISGDGGSPRRSSITIGPRSRCNDISSISSAVARSQRSAGVIDSQSPGGRVSGGEGPVAVHPGAGIRAVETQAVPAGEPHRDGRLPGAGRAPDPEDVLHAGNVRRRPAAPDDPAIVNWGLTIRQPSM